jgi:hypothetical protein
MDDLEQFIKNNRNGLDKYDPSPEIWERIRQRSGSRNKQFVIRLSVAAIITVVLGTALTIYFLSYGKNPELVMGDQERMELKETEIFYNSMVSTLYREAKPMLTSQPEIENELNTGLAQIDSICNDLKKDLKDNVANQEVIEALIQNYRFKIQLLEDMLNVLKENEPVKGKNESHEL